MHLRAYLRASTQEQDAQRARAALDAFAADKGLTIAAYYPENESGASLKRPELFRLLHDSHPGDVMLIEQVDRLSRLNADDWQELKIKIQEKRVRVVALDLPTSWQLVAQGDELTQRMMEALNPMMLDMLAAVARKDYEDRRRRVAQGIAKTLAADTKAREDGELDQVRYRGRRPKVDRNRDILGMLEKKLTWSEVCRITGASRSTLSRLVKASKEAQATATN